jgi:hypothetical protein
VTEALRIAMWSGPRNISTAMMRSFGNRPDTAVIDEPFYAAYLAATGLRHPMREVVLASQPVDWRDVVKTLTGAVPEQRPVFYQKHMTHHMLAGIDRRWMAACRNVFLIRSPSQVLLSYRARHDHVTLDDIGITQQAALFDSVCDTLGQAPPVIDAADILAQPEAALRTLCAALGLPFTPAMLQWPPGRQATDGVWAPAWYQSVEASTGFAPAGPAGVLDQSLHPIAAAAWPFYERLSVHRIRVVAPNPSVV